MGKMQPVDKSDYDDKLLIRYLLGGLPDDETQRLDEMSVADDDFALRLRSVEDDLVDSYARGELSGEILEGFKSFYLSSPLRRQKLAFAETLRARELKTAAPPAQSADAVATSRAVVTRESPAWRSGWRIFSVPRLTLQWGFAGAGMAMAFVAGFLFLEVGQLKRQMTGAESEREALGRREQSLEKQVNEQRAANAQIQNELERLRNEASRLGTIKSIAVLLMPQTRGTGQPVSVSVPTGINALPVRLELESDEFPVYQVTLKKAGSDRAVWHATKLKAESKGKNRSLSISIPAKVLKQETYVLETSGIPAKGSPEFLSGYIFRVVLE
jgi:hypothetical protein